MDNEPTDPSFFYCIPYHYDKKINAAQLIFRKIFKTYFTLDELLEDIKQRLSPEIKIFIRMGHTNGWNSENCSRNSPLVRHLKIQIVKSYGLDDEDNPTTKGIKEEIEKIIDNIFEDIAASSVTISRN